MIVVFIDIHLRWPREFEDQQDSAALKVINSIKALDKYTIFEIVSPVLTL